ncbi:MAG: ATP-binding protein [Aggregatilineales bacterium]
MRRWFAQPQLADEYETFAARVLHYSLLVLMFIALLFIPFASSLVQLVFFPALLVVLGYCYYLLHSGHIRIASLGFVSGLWLIVTVAAFSINGILNASLTSYAIVITFSALFFSSRTVIIFTGLSVLSAVILTVGDSAGFLPLSTTPLYIADRFFQLTALFTITGILLSAASRVIRSNIGRIRKHEETLLQRNRELEAEIAERRRIEVDLRISEEKYRLLFQNTSVMAAVYGQDGEIILLNNAAAEIFGGTVETLIGRNMRDVLDLEDAESAIKNQLDVMQTGKPNISESQITLPNGREVSYLRQVIPLPDPANNKASQVLVLTTDQTEKHRAQQQERELALAREKNDFMVEFFSTLSHDLKTPLTVMKTSIYLLKRVDSAEKRQQKIDQIDMQITLLEKYIQDMLTISQLDHLPVLDNSDIDVNALISKVALSLQSQIESRQINFEFQPDVNLDCVRGDEEQLQRLFMNLIENAINYTPNGGRVWVNTKMVEKTIEVDIKDSGIGIEADAIPHIFDRFYRTSKAQGFHDNGTGLGLAIVKSIVDMHKATIDVKSQLDEGTTFTIQFPATITPESIQQQP